MIFEQDKGIGAVELAPPGPFVTGARVTLAVAFTIGDEGLGTGARIRVGLPNTGWEEAVVPQLRYWDELVQGKARAFAPFHPVNTTAEVKSEGGATIHLEAMERMLLPDEDPAEAYWRWWVTGTVEEAPLAGGDQVVLTYGDPRFVGRGARVQTFPERDLTLSVYVDRGDGQWVRPDGAPIGLDVVPGPPVRANMVMRPVRPAEDHGIQIGLTDASHCRPEGRPPQSLVLRDEQWRRVGSVRFTADGSPEIEVEKRPALVGPLVLTDSSGEQVWGKARPCFQDLDQQLYWGDLHAQSEYHVMHSQAKDARQPGWAKGISCGTPDELYQYAREVSLLDFVAITDQGAITGTGWEVLQEKAAEYDRPGAFVTFRSYEAGSPVGHRNVYFRDMEPTSPEDPGTFSYMPDFLYDHYRGRDDVILVPHHVKTWTDWSYHDPDLEPLMEIYSCWGQSEDPSTDRWNKGMTPGAGAWEALRRGYRLGMIASSDNHVGMPGRSYPHDRQVHTPFPGGLAAIYAPELTREALFDAMRDRLCYGTTGARISLWFTLDGKPMGSVVKARSGDAPREIWVSVLGTGAIDRVEVLRDGEVIHTGHRRRKDSEDVCQMDWEDRSELRGDSYYAVRVYQEDGEMAWSSPVWVEQQTTDH